MMQAIIDEALKQNKKLNLPLNELDSGMDEISVSVQRHPGQIGSAGATSLIAPLLALVISCPKAGVSSIKST